MAPTQKLHSKEGCDGPGWRQNLNSVGVSGRPDTWGDSWEEARKVRFEEAPSVARLLTS